MCERSQLSDRAEVRPFRVEFPQSALEDLRRRLGAARWPERETVHDCSQGVPFDRLAALVEYWQFEYDWRDVEAKINAWPNFITQIDGLDIHFIHVRSPEPDALPLVMTHGWPGSIIEFLGVIGPLTDPVTYGGTADQAFHLVLPTLPGFGFSAKPDVAGWGRDQIARAWHVLMGRLGYSRYVAQGGDWGAMITQVLGRMAPDGLAGIHINFPAVLPPVDQRGEKPEEIAALAAIGRFYASEAGYYHVQTTRPQTLGYALADSPIGQAAWIFEKFLAWTDSDGEPERLLGMDRILDATTLYWLTNSAASSARLYWENSDLSYDAIFIDIPVAVSLFPKEHYAPPRAWAERAYSRLIYWNEAARGGHFAALEQPAIFTEELRQAFREHRGNKQSIPRASG